MMFCGCEASESLTERGEFTSVAQPLFFLAPRLQGLGRLDFCGCSGVCGWVKKKTPYNAILCVIRGLWFRCKSHVLFTANINLTYVKC